MVDGDWEPESEGLGIWNSGKQEGEVRASFLSLFVPPREPRWPRQRGLTREAAPVFVALRRGMPLGSASSGVRGRLAKKVNPQ